MERTEETTIEGLGFRGFPKTSGTFVLMGDSQNDRVPFWSCPKYEDDSILRDLY